MFSVKFGRRTLTSAVAGMMLALAVPALAQTGRVQGKVVDEKDQPVADAQILVTAIPDQGGQKWQAKSDKNGNYIIGTLPKSGQYLIVASKEGVGEDEARAAVKIGNFTTTNFKLSRAARVSEEQAKKNQEIKKYFEAGVAAANAGNHQAAVDAFTSAGVAMPTCADCYFNVGVSQQQLKNSAAAEAAFRKAIELRPNYPEAYNALAVLYTQDKKMDLAAEASAKAAELSIASAGAGGGNADSLYSAGVGLWNANKFAEAGTTFEAAIKADPNHADSHFMLGKVYLNLGKLKEAAGEYEIYLKLQPAGKNAAEAKTTFEALKPMLK
jgi:tetratricopeptide (TPR) repeat protein